MFGKETGAAQCLDFADTVYGQGKKTEGRGTGRGRDGGRSRAKGLQGKKGALVGGGEPDGQKNKNKNKKKKNNKRVWGWGRGGRDRKARIAWILQTLSVREGNRRGQGGEVGSECGRRQGAGKKGAQCLDFRRYCLQTREEGREEGRGWGGGEGSA